MWNTGLRLANKTSWLTNRRKKFKKSYPRLNKVSNVAGKVFGLQQQVNLMKGMINSERMYIDKSITSSVSTTGSVNLLTAIAAGDDEGNRTGNSILAKYMIITGQVSGNSSATNTIVRILVVMDTANQGSTPSTGDILESVDINSQKRIDNSRRFVTLKDKKYALSKNGQACRTIKIFIKLNTHLRYYSTTATDVLQNAVYALLISNEATNTPALEFVARLAYYDN